ncbi:MAG: bifunctional 5,10-methylenetetrahydrofolate dehydrogenase/5,10-methenyltetrahydrofolate cyclohydrolase [Candidatus Taylorbacteria bacterium]|nr:bifunctional 5,10-methylenetetrahydrofolate dehydrogenase/5,10-methenyltetrahydrofolate cyclohydrolase [Candidatus Taylorbacteria bacterium]
MPIILDGKKVAKEIAERLKKEIKARGAKPALIIVSIAPTHESKSYIGRKKRFGAQIGARVEIVEFKKESKAEEIGARIRQFNADSSIHGIIVQLPLPPSLDRAFIIESVNPLKDVDGLTAENLKLLSEGTPRFIPATTKGILALLDSYHVDIKGQKVVIVGRSSLVGKPTALSLLNRDATVTICHRQTPDLMKETRAADVLITAAGHAGLIGREHVREGQVVVDVGINSVSGGGLAEEMSGRKIVGDVRFDEVSKIVSAISPAPGGVGPMTVASLFENLWEAYKTQS